MSVENVKWSADGETYNYDSLSELLDCNDDIEAGRVVYFGEASRPGTTWIDADDVIEMIGERAYDVGGESAECFPEVSPEAIVELSQLLVVWQAKHCQPTFWTIPNSQQYVVTEADMAGSEA